MRDGAVASDRWLGVRASHGVGCRTATRARRMKHTLWISIGTWVAGACLGCASPSPPDDVAAGDASDISSVDGGGDAADTVSAPDAVVDGRVSDGACDPRSLSFERRVLDTAYRGEGVGAFDINGDRRIDIVTDQFWYESPSLVAHAIRAPVEYDRLSQFALGFGAFPMDVNGDGCLDILASPHPADPFYWYENPCGRTDAASDWTRRVVADPGIVGLESPIMVDLFHDGRPVVISSDYRAGQMVLGWYERPASVDGPWTLRPISAPGFAGAGAFIHGIGVGNLDGDTPGDTDDDVLTGYGWFENTGDRARWIPHITPNPFPAAANACSRMWTYDVNNDGLADVFCSRPHEPGIHWFEQRRVGTGRTFIDHLIDDSVTEMHALRLADLDGDGIPEIVSGTRWCSHCGAGSAPDSATPFVVYYSMVPGAAPCFTRHVVDDASGVGVAFDIADVDGDGRLDIVTQNKNGLFFFRQRSS